MSCLVADQYPEIHACFDPSERVARARVYFRAQGTPDWYYVDMQPEEACFKGVLPRPRASVGGIDYYLQATDQEFAESRTAEYLPTVVEEDSDCEGVVAPYVGTATVVVGALSGAAFPAGFVGGGLLGLGVSTATVAVVAGTAVAGGAVVAGGGGDEPPSTPGPAPGSPPGIPPGGPVPLPNPTPTPTPTPAPGACVTDDSDDPSVVILEPGKNEDVGAIVRILAEARDPGPVSSGLKGVVIYAEEQGGSRQMIIATFGSQGPLYDVDWTLPSCVGPSDRWNIHVAATDHCDRTTDVQVRVKREKDSCAVGATSESGAPMLLWTSELTVPDARGQVIANGRDALFPGTGPGELRVAARNGHNRVEAILASGGGEAGLWRFSLAAGMLRPGSLRALAGDVVAIGPAMVTFSLAGRPGERVAFGFDVE